MPKNFRARKVYSSSSSDEETEKKSETNVETSNSVNIKEKIEEIKFLQKQRVRTHGVDVYSLAIGESENNLNDPTKLIENDPWKSKTGGLVDMKKIMEKRGNEIVKNMHSTFAKETNQRDEDAEMQKFIEEQLRLKKESEKSKEQSSQDQLTESNASATVKKYKTPQDALFDVPKYLIESHSKHKSEETLSEQMLSGIPEVDLGVEERIRNIEETEKAKQIISQTKSQNELNNNNNNNNNNISNNSSHHHKHHKTNENSSVNFVQHKRFDETLINADKHRMPSQTHSKPSKQDPVVGDAPKHELLQQQPKRKSHHDESKPKKHHKPKGNNNNETVERASDDYCLEKFKKNMRFKRSTKIKIA